MKFLIALLAATGLLSLAQPVFADGGLPWGSRKSSNEVPNEIKDVGINEHLGSSLDPNLTFTDDNGKVVKLGDYFNQKKPVVLSPVYFNCPNLCNLHLNGITAAFKELKWTIGKEFIAIAVSIDPQEDHTLAAAKKETYIKEYGRPEAKEGWHFLTGTKSQVEKLTSQLGFKYKWDEQTSQWSHSAMAGVITPQGVISRYLYGVVFSEKTLRLSLVESSNGLVGQLIDKVVLFCFKYDPARKTYAFYAYNLVKVGAALTVIVLGFVLFSFWMRQRRTSA